MISKKALPLVALGMAGALLLPSVADAHHPEISVSTGCIGDNESLVSIHVEAWKTWDDGSLVDAIRRVNNNVVITMTNSNMSDSPIVVAKGHFGADNNYQFSATTLQKTAVGPVTARVTSVDNWGPNGEFEGAGEFRTASVDLTDDCKFITPPTTTTSSPVTTIPTVVTTTTPADSSVIERTKGPAEAVPVQPRFAG